MKISVIGTGMVGQTIAAKLLEMGNEVYMGTRDPDQTKDRTEKNRMTGMSFYEWYEANPGVRLVKYDELPDESGIFINATNGMNSLAALSNVGKDRLAGKVLLDLSNPLDFSNGFPPTLSVCNDDSLAEQIQREFPETHVVKSLNTMTTGVMVNPGKVPGDHTVFVGGNESSAKEAVRQLLIQIGWKESNIFDLGDITSSRGAEMILPLWLRIMNNLGHPHFNFNIVK